MENRKDQENRLADVLLHPALGQMERPNRRAPLGSVPFWGPETPTPPVSDPYSLGIATERGANRADAGARWGEDIERGCVSMARIARIAGVLSALATIFLVAGASTKY